MKFIYQFILFIILCLSTSAVLAEPALKQPPSTSLNRKSTRNVVLFTSKISNQKISHTFTLSQTNKPKPQYVLHFQDGKKSAQSKIVSESFAQMLADRTNNLIWQNGRRSRRQVAAAGTVNPVTQRKGQHADRTRLSPGQSLSDSPTPKRCQVYATLSNDREHAKICIENRRVTAQAFGYFHSLRAVF